MSIEVRTESVFNNLVQASLFSAKVDSPYARMCLGQLNNRPIEHLVFECSPDH
jgi:hypothetical protein